MVTNDDRHDRSQDREWFPSRRHVLLGLGGAGASLALGSARGQSADYELGGRIEAWQGQAPGSIEGQENPTLSFQAGQEYTVVWENLDGQPHNFAIWDANDEPIVQSEIISEQGATQTVTFTATAEMVTYICEVHPTTMVGDVQIEGAGTGTPAQGTAEPTEEPAGAGFFEQGTEVGVQTVAEGMTAPTDFALPHDDTDRWFVTDQTGEVWIVTGEGRQETPFMNVSDRMVTLGEFNGSYADPESAYDERGLLGIEFHPDFANNRLFYLHYSAPPNENTPDGWDHVEVVSEFTASDDGTSADLDSERKLLQIQSPQYNHNSGPMAFGPDGYLYVPMGDGGGRDDELYGHVDDWYDANAGGNGQDVVDNLLGDILRIDVDQRQGGASEQGGAGAEDAEGGETPYGIPEDNPFVGSEGRDEIWAYGFRNPYGISFDSEGNCFVASAGQDLFEEVSVVEQGGNYGWNVKEGTHCFSSENPQDPGAITDCPSNEPDRQPYDGSPLIDPVVEFPHQYNGEWVGITVVGGHRYEAGQIDGLQGKYVFGTWTTDPGREQPAGRILAATPPADFDGEGGDATAAANGTAMENESGAGNGTAMDNGTQVDNGDGTPGDGQGDPGDIPLDQLWEMEELVVTGGLDYFVRMFGQGPNGEVYVLVNERGVPEGDTGAVLELVPPGEGATPGDGTPSGNSTE